MANYSDIKARGKKSFANAASFPATGNTGEIIVDQSTGKLHVWKGSKWNRVASGADAGLNFTTEPDASYNLASDGTSTTVTLAATDPDGFPVTYDYLITPANQSQATIVNNNDGTFTVTPSTDSANAGNFTIRFKANDGRKVVSKASNFTLAFDMDMEYLVVAGGGGGGGNRGGGGGAGGLIYSGATTQPPGRVYTITVGTGGNKGDGWFTGGSAGTNSEISATGTAGWTTVTAIGGGVGPQYGGSGGAGGSGGGASKHTTSTASTYYAGTGTAGQGNDGGGVGGVGGAGGGGAGGVGGNSGGGAGGVGVSNSITGTAVYYAGGGGGGESTPSSSGGAGGNGGGGTGGDGSGTNGTDGLGGGGGGGGDGYGNTGGDGGDGIVIIRTTATALSTTGSPTLTTDGNYNIYSFTASGTIAF